nr:hypothetical protein [Tanacetum cinerariifolium]
MILTILVFDQAPQYTIDHQPDEGMSKSDIVFEEIKIMFQQLMERLNEENQARIKEMNQVTHTSQPSRCFNSFCYDEDDDYDYEESDISLNETISQEPPSNAITLVLPTIKDPEDSLIMRNEDLSTIPEKESDEFINSNVEDLVPIPSESNDTSGSDSECILPSCDYFSPIDVPEEKSVSFPNPLYNSNNDFTPSDDELLSDEDVSEDNVKIYSNPLFEFDDEYISSDPDLLVTPLSDVNKDECFDPGGDVDEVNDFEDGYYDSEGDIIYLECFLSNDTTPSLPSELLELMLSKRSKKNTKCVNAVSKELTAAKHKLMLLVYSC